MTGPDLRAGSPSIRSEVPADAPGITALLERSFPGEPEVPELVALIRRSADYVPALTLVAAVEGKVIGFVMLSRVIVRGERDWPVLSLAPLGVDPDHQRQGIGGALTVAALDGAETRGEPLVVLEGIPSYYPRFGFEPALALGIDKPHTAVADAAFMAKRLSAYDPRCRGRLVYPAAFYESGAVPV